MISREQKSARTQNKHMGEMGKKRKQNRNKYITGTKVARTLYFILISLPSLIGGKQNAREKSNDSMKMAINV